MIAVAGRRLDIPSRLHPPFPIQGDAGDGEVRLCITTTFGGDSHCTVANGLLRGR